MPEIRFIADRMLGKLAKWLRILGYDTEYCRAPRGHELIERAAAEGRQILTRDTRLGTRAGLQQNIFIIRANDPMEQLREVISHYRLNVSHRISLTRCLLCNGPLEKTSPLLLTTRIPDHILSTEKLFLSCPRCQKVYWRGSHYHNMQDRIKQKLLHG